MAIRVLLADDHAVVRDGLRYLLEAQGDITVVGDAANGRQAVDQVRKLQPNVVIMDIAMPRLHQAVPTKSPLESLSLREREVLQLVVEGKSSAEISNTLYLSVKTVETYRSRLMLKLGVSNLLGLLKFAIQHSLTPE